MTQNAEDRFELLGRAIDELDSLAHALQLPLRDGLHVEVLRQRLPEVVNDLKAAYAKAAGENPWE